MFSQPPADRFVQAATAALANGDIAQAASLLDEAVSAHPNHPMALTRQAQLALLRKDHGRALALTNAALATEPNFAPAWHHRASAFWQAGQQADAVQAARLAMEIQPPNPEFRLRFAQFAAWTGHGLQVRDALVPLLAAGQHDTVQQAAALSMLGELAIAEGRFEEANTWLDQALALHQGLKATRMLRGMNRLRLGQFHEGWVDYAAREGIAELNVDNAPPLAGPPWEGQTLAGKTLAVIDDQGHGDAIQFFRYLPLLYDRGARHITWRTFPPLVRLLGDAAPGATVVNALPVDAQFDFQCNSTSLPRWLGTEPDTIPAEVPYLWPPARLKSAMRRPAEQSHKIGRRERTQPRVGLVWSGDGRHTRDHLRSIPGEQFLVLADIPGIGFHSLQHEVRPADLLALEARPPIGREVEKAVDLADTAALIARLDLVIAVDTAIAHLAGAMGKLVWIVLHVAPDWRWLTARPDTPWYSTARLFRVEPTEWLLQGRPSADGGWGPVLARVGTALRTFAATRALPESPQASAGTPDPQPGIIRPNGRPANR